MKHVLVDTRPLPQTRGSWLSPDLGLLWCSQGVGRVGAAAFNVSALLWVAENTHAAFWVAVTQTLAFLPSALLGLLGGVAADRYSRRGILLVCTLFDAVAILAFAALSAADRPFGSWSFACLLLVVAGGSATQAFLGPAEDAWVAELVPRNRLARTYSIDESSAYASAATGAVLGPVLMAAMGMTATGILIGVLFVVATAALLFMRRGATVVSRLVPPKRTEASLFLDLCDSLSCLRSVDGLLPFEIGLSLVLTVFYLTGVLLVFYITEACGLGAAWMSVFIAATGIGGAFGLVLAGRPSMTGRSRRNVSLSMIVAMGLGLPVLGFVPYAPLALTFTCVGGVCISFIVVQARTLAMVSMPQGFRGRMVSWIGLIRELLPALVLLVIGKGVDATGRDFRLIFSVCGAVVLAAAVYLIRNQKVRRYLDGDLRVSREYHAVANYSLPCQSRVVP